MKELFEGAGIRTVVPEDMERAIWYKYMCNVSENQTPLSWSIPLEPGASAQMPIYP